MTNTRISLLAVATLLTVPLGCDPDSGDEPIDSDVRLADESEDDEDVTVDYYGTRLTMADIDDMGVHCTVVGATNMRCFDTIEEADAVHVPAADSLTAEPDYQAVDKFCRFFEHSGYAGSTFRVDWGYQSSSLGWYNDRFSSIECANAKSRVYEHSSFNGDVKDFGSTTYVGNLWNDQISSVKVISLSNGHADYCLLYGPCEAGEGDCDGNWECESPLSCGTNNGPAYGFGATTDVCY